MATYIFIYMYVHTFDLFNSKKRISINIHDIEMNN